MQQLIKNIEQWAEDRNLIKGSTPQKQMLKLMEEFGELCGGVARNNPEMIKDAIGDCFVVLVILNKQLNTNANLNTYFVNEELNAVITCHQMMCQLYDIQHIVSTYKQNSKSLANFEEVCNTFISYADFISKIFNFTIKDCIQHAYDQIKDRKGRMIDGVFVKAEDL